MTATQTPNRYEALARAQKVQELASLARLNHIPAQTLALFTDQDWDNLRQVANVYRVERGFSRMMGTPSETTRALVLQELETRESNDRAYGRMGA